MPMRMHAHPARTALAGLLLLAACSSPGSDTVPPPAAVASVSVSGSTSPMTVGATAQLAATPRDASGTALTGRTVTWSTDAAAVATVSGTGLVTAIAPGPATITATSEGIAGSAAITVIPVAVASIAITAPKLAFLVGDASQYSAQPKDAQGNPLAGRSVAWSSTQTAVATVSSAGLVTAVGVGTSSITASSEGVTSAATVITVTSDPALVEERVLAQQGLAIALASTVLQSQLYTLVELVAQGSTGGCVALPGGGGLVLLTATTVIPFQIGFYFDAACSRVYMKETVTTFTADNSLGNYHIIANALYTGPTGTALGSIAFDESANSIALGTGNRLTGTVNGLGTYTSLVGAPSVRLGLNCNLVAAGHNIGICQGGIAQDFAGQSAAFGSVTTLALDSTAAGTVTLSGTSLLTSGALGALTLTQPTATSMVVNGGSTYGTTADAGGAASFTLFPPTPTGWNVTDAAHDQLFAISVADNSVRNLVGSLKRISTGATLATIALDQSGTGTITYSDNTTAPITSWMLSQ
jgi:trimeric autotransporter adhesin